MQESTRKDIERVFGILKAKWGILIRPLSPMSVDKIKKLVSTCTMLNNMILKNDGNVISSVLHTRNSGATTSGWRCTYEVEWSRYTSATSIWCYAKILTTGIQPRTRTKSKWVFYLNYVIFFNCWINVYFLFILCYFFLFINSNVLFIMFYIFYYYF